MVDVCLFQLAEDVCCFFEVCSYFGVCVSFIGSFFLQDMFRFYLLVLGVYTYQNGMV